MYWFEPSNLEWLCGQKLWGNFHAAVVAAAPTLQGVLIIWWDQPRYNVVFFQLKRLARCSRSIWSGANFFFRSKLNFGMTRHQFCWMHSHVSGDLRLPSVPLRLNQSLLGQQNSHLKERKKHSFTQYIDPNSVQIKTYSWYKFNLLRSIFVTVISQKPLLESFAWLSAHGNRAPEPNTSEYNLWVFKLLPWVCTLQILWWSWLDS